MWSSASKMNAHQRRAPRLPAGFTLTEVMISMSILSLLLGGILTGVVGIAKSNLVVSNHAHLNATERNAIEQFCQDVRQLDGLSAFASDGFTGTLPSASGLAADDVLTYAHANGTLTRTLVTAEGVTTSRTPLTGISDFTLSYWTGGGLAAVPGETSAGSIKIVQLDAVTELAAGTRSTVNTVISARFTIRSVGSL